MNDKWSILALALSLCVNSFAASYHIAANGNDSRTVAQAQVESTPWASFNALSKVSLLPGDSVLLKRGDTFRGLLRISASGTAGLPIVVAAYGAGTALPRISGGDILTGVVAGSLYTGTVMGSVKGVFVDDELLSMARFPTNTWLTASSVEGGTALTNSSLSGTDWTGASVHLRTSAFGLETYKITESSGGRIVFPNSAISSLPPNVQFFVSNHAKALSSNVGWFQGNSTTLVNWRLPSGLSPKIVEAAVRPRAIELAGADYVKVVGIEVAFTTDQGIFADGKGVWILNCKVRYPGKMGIQLTGRESKAEGNLVVGAANSGIRGGNAKIQALNNTVYSAGLIRNFGPDGMGEGCCTGHGIIIEGDTATIQGNEIDSIGFDGVTFTGTDSRIVQNRITRACMTIDDCGGIYTITGYYNKKGAQGSIVRHNIVQDAVGAPEGWAGHVPASHGIYLDDGSHDILVDSNICSGNDFGIYMHNSQRDTVKDNVFFRNRVSSLTAQHDGAAGAGDMDGNLVRDNLFATVYGYNPYMQYSMIQDQSMRPLKLTGNVVCQEGLYSLSCVADTGSIWSVPRLDVSKVELGAEILNNPGFDNSVSVGWQGGYTLKSGAPCDQGNCLAITTANTMVVSQEFTVGSLEKYHLSFRVRGNSPSQVLNVLLRRNSGDYATVGLNAAVQIEGEWKSYEINFITTDTAKVARLDFTTSKADTTWWLDDVSLKRVNGMESPLVELVQLFMNPTMKSKTLSTIPSGTWQNWLANPVNGSTVLGAYSGVLAFQSSTANPPSSILVNPMHTNMQVWATQGVLYVTGLRTNASVYSLQGQKLADLFPDAQGNAAWDTNKRVGVIVLKAAGFAKTFLLAKHSD